MSARWTTEEDEYLALYFDVAGAFNMEIDLGRPAKQCTARVKKLKECGAWEVLRELNQVTHELRTKYLVAVGRPPQEILDERFAAAATGARLGAADA